MFGYFGENSEVSASLACDGVTAWTLSKVEETIGT